MTGAYTHGHHGSVLRSHRWRTAANSAEYLLPHLRPGLSLLDVGCGPATITADLARVVGRGAVVGIDPSASVIEGALVEYPELDLRVAALDDVDGRFDVVHAHQVVQHVTDPVGFLAAMAARVAPGGVLAVRDGDYPSMIWSPDADALAEWLELYHEVTSHNGANDDAGRHLPAWALAAGITDFTYTTSTWTYTADDAPWWADVWAERVVASSFAEQAVAYGLATDADLPRLADGWRAWGAQPGATFTIVHGELLAHP
jgi:SAM-dependent methyltransferase